MLGEELETSSTCTSSRIILNPLIIFKIKLNIAPKIKHKQPPKIARNKGKINTDKKIKTKRGLLKSIAVATIENNKEEIIPKNKPITKKDNKPNKKLLKRFKRINLNSFFCSILNKLF